jgi:hypothetical protein
MTVPGEHYVSWLAISLDAKFWISNQGGQDKIALNEEEQSPSIDSPSVVDTPGSQGGRGRPKRKRGNDESTDIPITLPIQSIPYPTPSC